MTATAPHGAPDALVEQLRPGGCLVYPARRDGRELLMRLRDGREEAVVAVRFVPLVEGTGEDG